MSTCIGEFVQQSTAVSPLGHGSAHSSPSQLVPQIECALDSLLLLEEIRNGDIPYLKIFEQPQSHFKFRYTSELQNSHGSIRGRAHKNNSNHKSCPGVELFNYNGRAIIQCTLVQFDNDHEHPHTLCVNGSSSISVEVPREASYKAWFPDLCIVQTPYAEVEEWLYRGYDVEHLDPEERNDIRRQCKRMAKLMQLNIVRLKFSAHLPGSSKDICAPVFSDPIRNLKSAATNILKICRLSRSHGRARGGDDVIMLVEKVIKSNIMIRFFELDENGKETWSDTGRFLESDVHHQYAIVCRTPPYFDINIENKVQVFVELVRPSDGRKSEPREFYFTPEQTYFNKKRKLSHVTENQTSISIDDSSLNNCVVLNQSKTREALVSTDGSKSIQMSCKVNQSPMLAQSSVISQESNENSVLTFKIPIAPSQMESSITSAINMANDTDLFENADLTEYFDTLLADFDGFVADSGRRKSRLKTKEEEDTYDDQMVIKMMAKELQKFVEMIIIKRESFEKRIEALFDLRLSNGDTFLHLTLDSKQPLLEYLINLIHDLNLTHLLNLKNACAQTILHQAVASNLTDMIPFLLSKGCDPMLEDIEGNNAFHYGVKNGDSLEPLLKATEKFKVPHNLDAYNYEKQTPLHFAVIHKSVVCVRLLLEAGASCSARDGAGRTPLHLAALDDCLPAALLLLEHTHGAEVNEVDDQGYTALQIVCDKTVTRSSVEMVNLLLENQADPSLHQKHNLPAWQLAKTKPSIRELLQKYIFTKGESDDEFQSADEGDSTDQDEVSDITHPLKHLNLTVNEEA